MSEKITQDDIDKLADIIWWIKGYHTGADDNAESCPFGPGHEEALRKARITLMDINKKEQHISTQEIFKYLETHRPDLHKVILSVGQACAENMRDAIVKFKKQFFGE